MKKLLRRSHHSVKKYRSSRLLTKTIKIKTNTEAQAAAKCEPSATKVGRLLQEIRKASGNQKYQTLQERKTVKEEIRLFFIFSTIF